MRGATCLKLLSCSRKVLTVVNNGVTGLGGSSELLRLGYTSPCFSIMDGLWLRGVMFSRTLCSKAEVITDVVNNKGIITLNRPEALNSMNMPMISSMFPALREWEGRTQCVILQGGCKGVFCAGGDVHYMTSGAPGACQPAKEFTKLVYTTVYMISHFKTPFIAIMDGLTMGVGAGISVHGKYRIVTERTTFAMPETLIGFTPDIGSSYFLPRLEGKLGLYLALTGHRLTGKDVVAAGLGTHYVRSELVPELLDTVLKTDHGDLDTVLTQICEDMSGHTPSLAEYMGVINEAFSAPTVEDIMSRLEVEGSQFSQGALTRLRNCSPTALKITKAEMDRGASMSLKECMQMEYRLSYAGLEAILTPDFYEGVRAVLKDKDHKPKWKPARLEDVTEDMVNQVFLPLSPTEELKL